MSLFNRTTTLLLLYVLASQSLNASSSFPRGCEVSGFGFDQNYLVLNERGKQAYYLLQNRSDTKIEIERYETGDAFMSPPLQALLEPMSWGAFASDVKDLYFKCYKQVEKDKLSVNCREILDVCQYPRAKFALSNMGNYWISFNKSQNEVIQDSVAKGIYLKW